MASILLVCTGNICRSPMAEGFLRATLQRRFGSRAPAVASAGTIALESAPVLEETRRAAAERGVDVSGHRAHRLRRADLEAADLVIGMAREHRDDLLRLFDRQAACVFTLKELVGLLERLPESNRPVDDPHRWLRTRVTAADRLRRTGSGPIVDGDVADPMGMSLRAFRAVAAEIDEWCSRLADGLFGPGQPADVAGGFAGWSAGA
jgi:protein-tyrosine phosphatase